MECFLPPESEDESKTFTTAVSVKEEPVFETQDPAASSNFHLDLYDVRVKVEPLNRDWLSDYEIDVEVSCVAQESIKKESMLVDKACDNAKGSHIITTRGGQIETSNKESCSSPSLDNLVNVDVVEDLYKCGICQKLFDKTSSLTMHMLVHDKDSSNLKETINHPYQESETIVCKVCGIQFKSLITYLKHRQTHLTEKPFQCEICEKDFNSKYLLTNHERTHTGEKPFPCDLCNKAFTEKVNLNRHMRSHSGIKPFRCEVCLNSFSLKHNLSAHMYSHTNCIRIQSPRARPFECEFCKKTWTSKKDLKRHLRIHTGEKPFSCEYCKKSFSRKEHLTYHLYSHTNERPYACEICDKKFIYKYDCNKHLKTHMTK